MSDLHSTCELPGCWALIEPSGRGRPRRYCTDEHRTEAHNMRRRTESRLAYLRDFVRRDEHLLAALGGGDEPAVASDPDATRHDDRVKAEALLAFVQWVATNRAFNGSDYRRGQSLYNECINAALPLWAADWLRAHVDALDPATPGDGGAA